MPGANSDTKRAQRHGLSLRMKAIAELRRCPKCNRRMAAKLVRLDAFTTVRICRWCGELS